MEERGKHAAHAVAQPSVKVVEHQLGAVAGGARVVLRGSRSSAWGAVSVCVCVCVWWVGGGGVGWWWGGGGWGGGMLVGGVLAEGCLAGQPAAWQAPPRSPAQLERSAGHPPAPLNPPLFRSPTLMPAERDFMKCKGLTHPPLSFPSCPAQLSWPASHPPPQCWLRSPAPP